MKLPLQWSWLFGPRRTASGALLGRRLSSEEEHTRIFSKTMMLQWASSYLSLLIIKSFIFRNKRSHCKCNIIHMQDLHHRDVVKAVFICILYNHCLFADNKQLLSLSLSCGRILEKLQSSINCLGNYLFQFYINMGSNTGQLTQHSDSDWTDLLDPKLSWFLKVCMKYFNQ